MTAVLITEVTCDTCKGEHHEPVVFRGAKFIEPPHVEVDDLPEGWSRQRVITRNDSFDLFACPECTPEKPKSSAE